ncbi:MAG: archaeal proteasome endopeptidase complex subunit beta [Candidatus Altiarchaeota archaeon]
MFSLDDKILKGTTTIGLTCKDGIVFAADKRASWGSFIASKQAKKTFKLNEYVGATVAGGVGDAESLMRLMQAEASLYQINNRKPMTAKAVATLLANILQGNKYYPYMVQLLIGGYSKDDGPQLFTLDPVGGLIEEDMAGSGSGSPVAYGVLEHLYDKEKTVAENLPVAVKALKSAMQRDSATGDGMSVVTVTERGYEQLSEKDIANLLKGA